MPNERRRALWAAIQHELRHLILQGLCVSGGLVGLWLGFFAAPKQHTRAAILPALAEVLLPVAQYVVAGVVAGAALALLLARACPWLRAS